MGSDIKITYINRSLNLDHPKIFLFTQNEVPTFDCLKDGVAWRVIDKIGRGSSSTFVFPVKTEVSANWDDGACSTNRLLSEIGGRYSVEQDNTGIVLQNGGNAANDRAIDVHCNVQTPGGISVNLYKDGRIMMSEQIVAYGQKATFVMHPKLYWGMASEIQEGEQISSAVLSSDEFFEQNLEGVSEVTVSLNGNAENGYQFKIEKQK